jgi:hypothetical protein
VLDRSDPGFYAFYPGTGRFNFTEANVVNVPIAPLWKAVGGGDRKGSHRGGERDGSGPGGVATLAPVQGREAVKRAILERLIPSLRSFGPDIIFISAGFDGAKDDVGNQKRNVRVYGMNLTSEDFAWITRQILAVARMCCPGRVVSVLEGGYGKYSKAAIAAANAAAAERVAATRAASRAAAAAAREAATAGAGGAAMQDGEAAACSADAHAAATAAEAADAAVEASSAADAAAAAAAAADADAAALPQSQGTQSLSLGLSLNIAEEPMDQYERESLVSGCAAHLRALVRQPSPW